MKNRTYAIWIGVLATASLCAGCGRSEADPVMPAEPSVHGDSVRFPAAAVIAGLAVDTANPAPARTLTLPGRLVWNEDHTVRVYTPYSGRIARIEADLGTSVTAGQTLALIASPEFGQAQSDARKAGADLKVASKNLERQKDLYANGVAAEKELEQAQADFERAQAENERARSLMHLFGRDVDTVDQLFALKSPLPGMVVERNLNPGQELRADQPASPIFVITDPSELWLQLDASEADLPYLKPGLKLELSTALYPGERFQAEITRVADLVDPTTRTIKIRGHASNPDRRLKGEMYVTAAVHVPAPELPAVPAAAVFLKDSQEYVFIAGGDNSYTRRSVSTAGESGGRVLVSSGLKAGERVVIQGALFLQQALSAASS